VRTVSQAMSGDVKTVSTNDVVGAVRDAMIGGHIGAIAVLDDHGNLAGIISASDLVEEWAPEMGVLTVMSDKVVVTTPTADLVDAARAMLEHRIHHLVVVDNAKVVGMLSSFDLLHDLAGEVEAASTVAVGGRQSAKAGDHIVIRGHAIGSHERRGRNFEARGTDGGPPYMVQWLDDPHDEPHSVLFFPGSDADLETL
jgi:Mg/Co/Ni transporter MgtE